MANCYLISKESPTTSKKQQSGLAKASRELKIYIKNIQAKFGSFEYYPQKTPYKAGMSVQSKIVDSSSPASQTGRSPAKAIRSLTVGGKPAAFIRIREAEEAKMKEEAENKDARDEDDSDDDMSESGSLGDKTRRVSESVSIDENSMDSVSQDSSSVCSMGSSQTEEKSELKTTGDKVADCAAGQKSRMGGMKIVVKKLGSKTSSDGIPELTPKSAELARRTIGQDDNSPKRPAPAGVFEITDGSLDIDQEKESPSVQLLGKKSVSPKRLKMSPEKASVSPKKSSGESREVEDKESSAKDSKRCSMSNRNRTEESNKLDGSKKDSVLPVKIKVEPTSAIKPDGDSESSSISTSGSSIILPGKLPDPSALDEADGTPKTPESQTPSTSKQSTPRSSDKFHLKLSKTIETMKASLGMESMETNENSESESESEEAASTHEMDHDSDSSDAHSDDETNMAENSKNGKEEESAKNGATEGDQEKTADAAVKDDGESKIADDIKDKEEESDGVKDENEELDVAKGKDEESDVVKDKDEESDIVRDKDEESDVVKAKDEESDVVNDKDVGSDVASECGGLAMSCHSVDDQSENELVIDMDRVDGQEVSSASKEPSGDENTAQISDDQVDSGAKLSDNGDMRNTKNAFVQKESDSTKQVSSSSLSAPSLPKLNVSPNFKKSQLHRDIPNSCIENSTASTIGTGQTSILASQKLTEIIHQKELEEKKQQSQPKVTVISETPRTEVGDEKKAVDKTESSGAKEDEVKDEANMELDVKLDDYPFEDEDPLKAWGTADNLLDKYAKQVRAEKCILRINIAGLSN